MNGQSAATAPMLATALPRDTAEVLLFNLIYCALVAAYVGGSRGSRTGGAEERLALAQAAKTQAEKQVNTAGGAELAAPCGRQTATVFFVFPPPVLNIVTRNDALISGHGSRPAVTPPRSGGTSSSARPPSRSLQPELVNATPPLGDEGGAGP